MGKTPEELFKEREQRVRDAVALKEPDRVPFLPFYHFFPAKFAGISHRDAMYDYDKLAMAWKKVTVEFEPDMYNNPFTNIALGNLMEILDFKQIQWPGGALPPDRPFQFVEKEYMKGEEYDDFLFDPTNYLQRVLFPRICGALESFQLLPPTPSLFYIRILTGTAIFNHPDVARSIDALLKAAKEAKRMLVRMGAFKKEMEELGFPSQFGGIGYAPFDYIGDLMRGTRGVLLDMYRKPDKLLAAMEKLIPYIIEGAINLAKASGENIIFIPLHKGLDGFMSNEHFKTFFWPSLRKVMMGLIDAGLVPSPFWEGRCDTRLEVIRDIPKGKAVYMFEQTDVFRAKEILGDRVCIRGNVPASMLCAASPQEITDYCKKLIEVVGKGGGFILDGAIGIPDEAKPENVKAMADVVKAYGRYD
jgi:uroporphyrinogen-III decarboxylase